MEAKHSDGPPSTASIPLSGTVVPSPENASPRLHSVLGRLSEFHFLFPVVTLLVLGVIWGATWNMIRIERIAAESSAAESSTELAETYEAQVVRALREIDQTLKLVAHSGNQAEGRIDLADLKANGLLPSDLLFVVSVVDQDGRVIASTRPLEQDTLAQQDDFLRLRQSDAIAVSLPWKSSTTGEWALRFSRRLPPSGEAFAGAVTVTVDAAYFASGYEASKLGQHGMLGLLGEDGVFRIRRTGQTISAGDRVDFAATIPKDGNEERLAPLVTNPWDGVERYTSASKIYGFPLAVLVGLSHQERLAEARISSRDHLWRAAAASALALLLIALLWRMSQQIARIRQREAESKLLYAKRIEYLAYHDGLTGLPNRSLFSKLLDQSISEARRYQRQLAVLFLDLDRFKQVNDTLGHEAGDELLKEVAVRLKATLRHSDTVARLGGDEFVVLLPELEDEKFVAAVAQKMLVAIARPFSLLGHEFRVTVSIGIGIYPNDGEDEQTLKKNADIAMYQAKEEGKNNFQFYSERLNSNSLQRLSLESNLRLALERGEFQLHYQAKREMSSGHITGMEALLRWQHPELGLVAPMQFIPIAEESGLIIPIGKWVLNTACQQNVAWQRQGIPPLSVAVNLTARQFGDENLLADIAAALANSGLSPHLLELEIHESMLMHDVERALDILKAFKKMGVRIAIDNFGVGYSSLSVLQRFPIDTIKIDRSFVRDASSATEGKDLTAAIIAMGRTLSLTVVAQGVETGEQAELLREQACDEVQGYYFNRPMAAEQFVSLLQPNASDTPPAAGAELTSSQTG